MDFNLLVFILLFNYSTSRNFEVTGIAFHMIEVWGKIPTSKSRHIRILTNQNPQLKFHNSK